MIHWHKIGLYLAKEIDLWAKERTCILAINCWIGKTLELDVMSWQENNDTMKNSAKTPLHWSALRMSGRSPRRTWPGFWRLTNSAFRKMNSDVTSWRTTNHPKLWNLCTAATVRPSGHGTLAPCHPLNHRCDTVFESPWHLPTFTPGWATPVPLAFQESSRSPTNRTSPRLAGGSSVKCGAGSRPLYHPISSDIREVKWEDPSIPAVWDVNGYRFIVAFDPSFISPSGSPSRTT